MVLQIFSVYDTKIEAFNAPIFVRTRGEAIRSFQEAVNDPQAQHSIAKHPQDHALFHIGSFDDETGLVTPIVPPASLGLAQEFITGDKQWPATDTNSHKSRPLRSLDHPSSETLT
ncbi:nonstructural protein [Apis mellifera associated microvirus 16]|nr:nonstructural protein [Apis mellifera associated microvirus 16]